MSHIEAYRKYFTKDYLMGPNSFRLLEELLQNSPSDVCFDRTLDLGCGMALTSAYLAQETGTRQVIAYDLWISATYNLQRIRQLGLEDRILPIHGDAMEMPFAHGYFDTIVSVDAYHYFGCREGVFAERILPFVREGGHVLIAVPGLREEPRGEIKALFETWAEGEDSLLFKTCAWWQQLLERECGDTCTITVSEAACYAEAWQDWFNSGHEYGLRDKEFLDKGLDQVINFVMICVKKKSLAEV